MILIIGSSKDDTLYFESVLNNKRQEKLFKRYDLVFGTLFKQDILVVSNVFSNYVSSAVISYLVNKYFVVLVFVVGKVASFTPDLKIGDILLARRTFLADVDQIESSEVVLGEIPDLCPFYESSPSVIEYTTKVLESSTYASYKLGTIISSNTQYSSLKQLDSFSVNGTMFGVSRKIGFESISGGVAVACELAKIPFLTIKVVGREFGKHQSPDDYSIVLRTYSDLGKALVKTIADISRNEIIKQEN